MKFLLLACCAFVISQGAHHPHNYESLAHMEKWIQEIKHSSEYRHMDDNDHALMDKILAAAKVGTPDAMTKTLDAITFDGLLHFIDKLDTDDVSHFEKYLAYHLQLHPATQTRDLHAFMSTMMLEHKMYEDLDHMQRKEFHTIMQHAHDNTLTAYLASKKGLVELFDVLAKTDDDLTLAFDHMVEAQLAKEASMHTTTTMTKSKRNACDGGWGAFMEHEIYKELDHGAEYHFQQIMAAAHQDKLTEYLKGSPMHYGMLFNVEQNVDHDCQLALNHLIEQQLEKEAKMTTAPKTKRDSCDGGWGAFVEHEIYKDLDHAARYQFQEIMAAAHQDKLTEYLKGSAMHYGALFNVEQAVDHDCQLALNHLIEQQLEKEAKATSTGTGTGTVGTVTI